MSSAVTKEVDPRSTKRPGGLEHFKTRSFNIRVQTLIVKYSSDLTDIEFDYIKVKLANLVRPQEDMISLDDADRIITTLENYQPLTLIRLLEELEISLLTAALNTKLKEAAHLDLDEKYTIIKLITNISQDTGNDSVLADSNPSIYHILDSLHKPKVI